MGLDALLAKLDADARREREEILSRATRQAEALRAQAEADLERARTRALDDVRAQEEAAARKRIVEARTEARRTVFQARQKLLGRIRSAAEERIDGGSEDDAYRSALPEEVAATLRRAPAGAIRIRAAAGLVDALRQAVAEARRSRGSSPGDRADPGDGADATAGDAPTLEVVPDDEVGTGFLAVGDGGAVIVDATLSARLERAWPAEAMRVLKELEA